jgi:hypothetical protein
MRSRLIRLLFAASILATLVLNAAAPASANILAFTNPSQRIQP